MIIAYQGHSFFTITAGNGTVIATDPYDGFYQYPKRNVQADICTVSHHHADHDSVAAVSPSAKIIDTSGVHHPANGIRIVGIETKHDDAGGTLRGENILFIIEADGLRIAHCGDLGHMLTEEQIKKIGAIDILLLPVGGFYTIDAAVADDVRKRLHPQITIPMHYRTMYNEEMPIANLEECLAQMHEAPPQVPLLRVVKEDIQEHPHMVVLIPKEPNA